MGEHSVRAWVGGLAEWTEGNTAYLSVAFTWLLDDAWKRARWYKELGYKVKAGGPAIFIAPKHLADVAELPPLHRDPKGNLIRSPGFLYDAVVRHNPDATIASRGCPVDCDFCIVGKMEGTVFTELPDFPVRPILCDNNLSALSAKYQDFIVGRYQREGVPLLDANSGFEPATFSEEVFRRWEPINKGPWRFAYDEPNDRVHVERVMRMLSHLPPKKKRVYVLIGNQPKAECIERLREVVAWGGEPHAQPYIKLNAPQKEPWVKYDWTRQDLIDIARISNRWLYRKEVPNFDLSLYRRSVKTSRDDRYDPRQGLFF